MKNIQKELANIKKGNYAPIYLVLGEERYFIEQIRETIIEEALDEEAMDLNFLVSTWKKIRLMMLCLKHPPFHFW